MKKLILFIFFSFLITNTIIIIYYINYLINKDTNIVNQNISITLDNINKIDYVLKNANEVNFIALQEGYSPLPYKDTIGYAICFGMRIIKLQDLLEKQPTNNADVKEIILKLIFYLNNPEYAEPIDLATCEIILDRIITLDKIYLEKDKNLSNLDNNLNTIVLSRVYNMGYAGFKKTSAYQSIKNKNNTDIINNWHKLPHKNRRNAEILLISN